MIHFGEAQRCTHIVTMASNVSSLSVPEILSPSPPTPPLHNYEHGHEHTHNHDHDHDHGHSHNQSNTGLGISDPSQQMDNMTLSPMLGSSHMLSPTSDTFRLGASDRASPTGPLSPVSSVYSPMSDSGTMSGRASADLTSGPFNFQPVQMSKSPVIKAVSAECRERRKKA